MSSACDPAEVARFDAAIVKLAKSGMPFTADDVRLMAGDPTRPNLLGARFRCAAQLGLIETCGRENSTRRLRHASSVWRWRGKQELVETGKKEDYDMAKPKNAELVAMGKISAILEPFTRDQRYRVLMYLIDLLGLSRAPEVEAPKTLAGGELTGTGPLAVEADV